MKKDIHPKYFPNAKTTCACKNVIVAGSTKEEQQVEICSACHPFYTGKQKLVDTAGRVDKFIARQKKAQAAQKGKKDK
jgi:large subunit ribosomal protein L31